MKAYAKVYYKRMKINHYLQAFWRTQQ